MRLLKWSFLVCALCALFIAGTATTASAGMFNETLSIGDAAPAWKDLPGTDGKQHSLSDFKDKAIVVVVFTCNSCPVATDYEDRILAFAKDYAGADGKVGLVAINVNRVEEDSLANMQKRAKDKAFSFPYLYDESQQIAKDYGATFTPEFFVLDKDRKIAYMGGMDDNSNADVVKHKYLRSAVDDILKGEAPLMRETVAVGCRIRYARQRAKP